MKVSVTPSTPRNKKLRRSDVKDYLDSLQQLISEALSYNSISEEARRESARLSDDDANEFTRILDSAMRLLGWDNQTAANKLRTARPTVARWRTGRNRPHWVARPVVISFCIKQLKNKQLEIIKQLELTPGSVEVR